jgi:pimeloyl-ACP methyl ester carboxylesterase
VRAIQYLYLHGFASSPRSSKANYFRECFRASGLFLEVPDLNGENFSTLTLSRQIEQVAGQYLRSAPSVTAIGSSLGGLTAAWLAQKYPSVRCLVLLAPAFGFLRQERDETILQQWKSAGQLSVYHYGYGRSLPIHYDFIRDLQQYREEELTREIPTLILHGRADEVISIERSREYARSRPRVKLIELDSDHGLTDVLPRIWSEVKNFLAINF